MQEVSQSGDPAKIYHQILQLTVAYRALSWVSAHCLAAWLQLFCPGSLSQDLDTPQSRRTLKPTFWGAAELSEVLLQMLHKDSPCKQYFQAASQYQYRQKRSYSINLKFWFHWAIWSD